MSDVKEQWIGINFCFKLSKTAVETHKMLNEAFGDNVQGQTQTYKWFKRFKNGWMSVTDEECSWWPLTRTTTENVAKVWHWRHRAKGICSTRTNGERKILLCHSEVTEGKHPDKWHNNSRAQHHDNVPAHVLHNVRQFLSSTKMTVIPHPPYSPDLVPCDFFLFPKMKLKLKGRHVQSTEEIQKESQKVIKTLTPNNFQKCFWSWKSCWNCCINAKGDYFKWNGGK